MAAWQFDLYLVPRATAARHGVHPDDHLTPEQFDAIDWWQGHPPASSYAQRLGDVLPWRLPWSDDWQVFGTEEGNRVDVLTADGRVEEMRARIDARSLDGDFVERLTAFARDNDLLLVSPEFRVFEPDLEPIWVELELSPARQFVRDPAEFLERIRRRQHNAT